MAYSADAPDRTVDRAIVEATQAGLPLVPAPYAAVADALGLPEETVRHRLDALLARGALRRIGAVPNHYRLGYRANGMTVWDVDDALVDTLGPRVGTLPFVSHCYRRPRRLPLWPYNLFAMVHGRDTAEADAYAEEIAVLLGPACRDRAILYSTRILKKTGLRFGAAGRGE